MSATDLTCDVCGSALVHDGFALVHADDRGGHIARNAAWDQQQRDALAAARAKAAER